MKKVAIIILHYKEANLTRQCLVSLKKLTQKNLKVQTIVVVNNPQENLSHLARKFPQVRFLETGQNLGFAEGNNVGMRQALESKPDYLLILNNDTLVAPDFLIQLIKVAERKKKSGLLVPKIYFAPGFEFHQERYKKKELGKVIWFAGGTLDWANIATHHRGVDEVDQGQYDKTQETEFITGCSMLIKRHVLEKIGLFDPRYFLYYEDADLCLRAQKAGFKLLFVPRARIWHQVAASSEIGGSLHDYFLVRNQLLFGLKHAPWRSKLALLKQSLRFLFFGRPWQKRGVVDFYLGKFGQGSWSNEK
jgi:GT2 family glycosyltransferase